MSTKLLAGKVPESLNYAIYDGLNAGGMKEMSNALKTQVTNSVREEIKNFLAHQFTADFMEIPEVRELWFRITGERK